MKYNAAFFGLFENVFRLLKSEHGEGRALQLFAQLMEAGLSKSYGTDFDKGLPTEFVRLVGERDKLVGLRVEFPSISDNEIVYQFHDDPFPGLKGLVDSSDLDRCYMSFKVKHILGDGWSYKTIKHLWQEDECTEHLLFKCPK